MRLSGLEINHSKVSDAEKLLGKPAEIKEIEGEGRYSWKRNGVAIEAYTLNAANPSFPFYCLRSVGEQSKGNLGRTGAGLASGGTKQQFEQLYGTNHTFDYLAGTGDYEAVIDWEGKSSLIVTFDSHQKVKAIKVLGDVE